MNRHQVITGAVNSDDHCYAVGTVEGVNFTACATGCDVVILSSDFQRVQIISGSNHGHVQVTCIDCSSDTGKIASCCGNKVYIYEPVPVFHRVSSHRLDYQWIETNILVCDSVVTALSWNQEGTRLLTGGQFIQLWSSPTLPDTARPASASVTSQMVSFSLGENDHGEMEVPEKWKELWGCKVPSPIAHLDFSPDGRYFASVGKADRLVKVWYRSRTLILPFQGNIANDDEDEREYSFIYLPHSRAVTSFSWRKTSRYMPRGAVANMLLTSCMDNICRLWVETILPDDGLLNMQHLDPLVAQNPKYRQHRHKRRFVERLKHMRISFKKAKNQRDIQPASGTSNLAVNNSTPASTKKEPIPTLPTSYSVHDFHKVGVHGTGVSPECHFHLAASVNADTDIHQVPAFNSGTGEPLSFVIHWLNNKDMNFTCQAEKLLHDLCKNALQSEKHDDNVDRAASPDPMELEEDLENDIKPSNGPTPQSGASRTKKPFNKFNSLKKKMRIPNVRSQDLLDEDTISVTSSGQNKEKDRHLFQPQASVSVVGSTSGESSASAPGDTLDREIENLVRRWHQSADLLFSIHPLDGSFLVWLVEWLDEDHPGSFRQPQLSYIARIPNALPLADAVTTCSNLAVYSTHSAFLDLYSMLKLSDDRAALWQETPVQPPVVSMISCHQNGSLNLWRINFANAMEFTAVISVGHVARVCGHRFRVNDMVSHPVLPLLLTTSHHNATSDVPKIPSSRKISQAMLNFTLGKGFCSELILWKVEPVGPLSKSGGITELARINSAELSAFSSCAWLPTLLPGWTLGNLSQTPSACFVASDGVTLRIYQAVIDAQQLLAEMHSSLRKPSMMRSESTISSSSSVGSISRNGEDTDTFNIVSLQSSARPGCILALDQIADARHDWHNTQFLHIFHEQVLKATPVRSQLEAVIDLTNLSTFEEYFYLTVLEKNPRGGSIMHMWSIGLYSKPNPDIVDEFSAHSAGEDDEITLEEQRTPGVKLSPSNLKIMTSKVCCQQLPLPADIEVVHATAAAGHLSSSAIYPACYAPYCIATACSDGTVRFWRCQVEETESKIRSYFWEEWRMMLGHSSSLTVPGRILGLSCAYSARIACAYRAGVDRIRRDRDEPHSNISVAIFECESTGGSEWVQEDKISVREVQFAHCSSPVPDPEDTLMAIRREKQSVDNLSRLLTGYETFLTPAPSVNPFLLSYAEKVSQRPKQCVSLDWVSTEDGSHVLTIGVGSQIMVYATVSSDIAQENMKAMADTGGAKRPMIRQASSFATMNQKGIYRWMRLRMIMLDNQEGAPVSPNQMAWVRTGLLILGMDNEMYVYSQWKKASDTNPIEMGGSDARVLSDYNLVRLNPSPSRMKVTKAMPSLMSSDHLKRIKSRKTVSQISQLSKKSTVAEELILDRGLFEAARIASPVLPQYHPKQLMELLNFGRLRRVQAILAHLLRCIKSTIPAAGEEQMTTDDNEEGGRMSGLSRQLSLNRRKSVMLSPGSLGDSTNPAPQDDLALDYIEVDSISPLPLFALLEADHHIGKRADAEESYDALFSANGENGEEASLDDLLDNDDEEDNRSKRKSRGKRDLSDIYAFRPNDATELARHITHMHLPGLSSLDQMHLLALADTVANCSGKLAIDTEEDDPPNSRATAENVDPCGLRYLLAVRQHVYLLRCLPMKQRGSVQKQGIESSYIAWAFHSENQQELLQAVTNIVHGDLKWSDIKELGIGWWLRSNTMLKTIIEKLAKNVFQTSQDPLDAALYYLAMKRKPVLHALFKIAAVKNQLLIDFFSNDFTQDRWRRAALKNAFALLGKQQFERAAAFFLLGGAVKDAVDIIMTKLNDVQLALVVVRLHDEDEFGLISENHVRILQDYVIDPVDETTTNSDGDPMATICDPFLQSISHWILKEYPQSLQTLLDEDREHDTVAKPSIFNFYDFLRSHPIVVRQVQASTKAKRKDTISSVERRLFFKTAHVYFRAGCPQLALEVLCKLPEFFYDEVPDLSVQSNAVNGFDNGHKIEEKQHNEAIDWGSTLDTPKTLTEEKLELDWDAEGNDGEEDEEEKLSNKGSVLDFPSPKRKPSISRRTSVLSNDRDMSKRTDIMAQQLKFIAGLKILMEELGSLATGFEVDGGQLRFILYMWLEKEVAILKLLCYKSGAALNERLQSLKPVAADCDERTASELSFTEPALHEALKADNMDFQMRLEQMTRRKHWLKNNQQLLRSLIHYCQLYGSNGGGLASVYMELTLLAHELYQGSVQQQQQLLTPLPFLTTLPLLSAFLTGPMTISSDPVNYISRMARDLLRTLADRKGAPSPHESPAPMYILRDIALALSTCVYQSLCESDAFQMKSSHSSSSGALERFAASLMNSGGYIFTLQRRRRRSTNDGRLVPTTQPSKWPGVQSLRALLARERDENALKLHVLLMETFIAVYMSMLATAVAIRDVNLLYRLVGVNFNVKAWSGIFGGGAKKVSRNMSLVDERRKSAIVNSTETASDPAAKQRNQLNAKVLSQLRPNSPASAPNDIQTSTVHQEVFVPPEVSIIAFLLTKPAVERAADPPYVDYDSDESIPSDDEADEDTEIEMDDVVKRADTEHSDPHSYSWAILRLTTLKAAMKVMQQVLTTVGVEQQDLPVLSPVLHSTMRTLEEWQKTAAQAIEDYGAAPEGFVKTYGAFDDSPAAKKNPYAILLDPANTPFQSDQPSALPVKRLWNYLIHQEYLQETFVKYMFKRRKIDLSSFDTFSELNSVDEAAPRVMRDAIRIVHKDQDIVTGFAINRANPKLITLSTSKEIQEINIGALLDPEGWLQDESEFNLLTMKNQIIDKVDPEFLVLQTPSDKPPSDVTSRSTVAALNAGYQVSTRGAYVMFKRPYKEVRRLTSHPMLPYYLSGSTDGSIRLWEFGHQKQLTNLRASASMAKINHLEFSTQGNKFGACDADGIVSLWQLGTCSNNAAPYISLQSHNKTCSAFTFLSSSSLLATAGHGSENRNVAIWDTLLPQRKSMVASFVCHDTGSPALVYASQHNLLITCGKKGDVCLFDMRQRQLRHKFQAHESGIRAVSLDATQEYFVTGSAEGDIKVWGLAVHSCLLSLPEEHKKQSFFRNASNGVMQLDIDAQNRLFSCGADGFFKIRTLQPQDYVVHTL